MADLQEEFDPAAVVSALKRAELIPDIFPESDDITITIPLAVSFPTSGAQVALGNEILVQDTQERPRVTFPEVENTTYTLVMIDPDAPFRTEPEFRSFRHWVITGLRDSKAATEENDVTPWRAPGPRDNSGIHRYTFLLFEEPKGGFVLDQQAPEWRNELVERRSWDVRRFARWHGLKLVGANFFLVRSKVPE